MRHAAVAGHGEVRVGRTRVRSSRQAFRRRPRALRRTQAGRAGGLDGRVGGKKARPSVAASRRAAAPCPIRSSSPRRPLVGASGDLGTVPVSPRPGRGRGLTTFSTLHVEARRALFTRAVWFTVWPNMIRAGAGGTSNRAPQPSAVQPGGARSKRCAPATCASNGAPGRCKRELLASRTCDMAQHLAGSRHRRSRGEHGVGAARGGRRRDTHLGDLRGTSEGRARGGHDA